MPRVSIVGTTTWGTTLAIHHARNNVPTTLLAQTPEEAQRLLISREHSRFLPNVPFPQQLNVTHDREKAFDGAVLIILAVPSQRFRENLLWIRDSIDNSPIILSATKGLEETTGKRMSQLINEELPERLTSRLCVLSGPNLAMEVVAQKPVSSVIASINGEAAKVVQNIIMSPTFRVYTNDDVVGTELGGALKNVIALSCGICDGLGYGDNAKSALITRGLAEITRLGIAAGANPFTFVGLAGLGDLVATCSSPLSRNRYVGEELSKGRPLNEILAPMKTIAEGIDTTKAALKMAKNLDVEMPITKAIFRVLFERLDVNQAIVELLGRPPKAEYRA